MRNRHLSASASPDSRAGTLRLPGPSLEDAPESPGESKPVVTSKSKGSGACVDCKSVKVRCEPVSGQRRCKRCELKDLPCRPRERKKRKVADTHEELQERARQQDLVIQDLLQQYDRHRSAEKISHWRNASDSVPSVPRRHSNNGSPAIHQRWRGTSPADAAISYFGRDSRVLGSVPDLVVHCNLYPEEIEELFKIYFSTINPYFSLLDPDYHKPSTLIWTAPFLFTVICAVASRHFTWRPEIYALAINLARDAAGDALTGKGGRTIEICQAYLITAVYPIPTKKWLEDRSWLLMGVAFRMALDLGLDRPVPLECSTRDRLNRERTWLNCFCVDSSHAIQYGKTPMLSHDNYLARSSASWYASSPKNLPIDVHLCGYVQILQIMGEWHRKTANQSSESGLNEPAAIETACIMVDRLEQEMAFWREEYKPYNRIDICRYRGHTTQLIVAYLQLVILAAAFEASLKSGHRSEAPRILLRALDRAHVVIQTAVDYLAPMSYFRYAMDANFVYLSFGGSFLLKLLDPQFKSLLDDTRRQGILDDVSRLVHTFEMVSPDPKHTSQVHARFLSSLLSSHVHSSNRASISSSSSSASSSSHSGTSGADTPNRHMWPNMMQGASPFRSRSVSEELDFGAHSRPQEQMKSDIHFSLNHFSHLLKTWKETPPPAATFCPDSLSLQGSYTSPFSSYHGHMLMDTLQ